MKRNFLAFLLILLGVPALAQDLPVSQAELDAIAERGRLLYVYDHAAWHTSQRLLEAIPDENQPEKGGWIIEPGESGYVVTYYGIQNGDRYLLAEFGVSGEDITYSEIPPVDEAQPVATRLNPLIDKLEAAIEAHLHTDFGPCTDATMNAYVLPSDAEGVTPVYVMSSQIEDGAFALGGHYRFDIDAANEVVASRRFLNSCLSLNLRGSEEGREAVGLVVSHSLDPNPIEIHVFASLWTGMPVHVLTAENRMHWLVTGDQIRWIRQLDEPAEE